MSFPPIRGVDPSDPRHGNPLRGQPAAVRVVAPQPPAGKLARAVPKVVHTTHDGQFVEPNSGANLRVASAASAAMNPTPSTRPSYPRY